MSDYCYCVYVCALCGSKFFKCVKIQQIPAKVFFDNQKNVTKVGRCIRVVVIHAIWYGTELLFIVWPLHNNNITLAISHLIFFLLTQNLIMKTKENYK